MQNDNQRTLGVLIIVAIVALAISRVHITSDDIIFLVLLTPTVVCHEVAHGAVAYLFGDDTAKNAGRLTLNPIKHIDLFGTILLPALFLVSGLPPFGYAKPVPVSLNKLRDPRTHGLLVGLAGPLTNFVLTTFSVAIIALLWQFGIRFHQGVDLLDVVLFFGALNIFIGVFNLLPVPPLDGSSILEFFLPNSMRRAYYSFRRYAIFILLFLILAGNNALGNVLVTIERPFVNQYVRAVACVTDGCGSHSEDALR